MSEEAQYLDLVKDILENGSVETGRNGNTISLFGKMMRFSLSDGKIPILTTKRVAWKTCLKELLWFILGNTNNADLNAQGVHIWDANCSREFLDEHGLTNYQENELGPIYGHQWRHFNAPWLGNDADYSGSGVDQLQYIIDNLMNPETRNSRRLIMSAWNPCQLSQMALPPCHIMCQFNVSGGNKLSCVLYQRSGDIGLGVPFNISSYCFLTHLLAKHCGLVAHEFIHFLGNCHIYDDHIGIMREQIMREPMDFPTLNILHKHTSIDKYTLSDFAITNYKSHDSLVMKMRP